MTPRRIALAGTLLVSLAGAPAAFAQAAPPPPAPAPAPFAVRVFGEGGVDRLTATRSFQAIFGRTSAPVFGGGVEVVVARRWFARVGAWRFRETGERALRLENQTFRLGIPLTVTMVPVEVSGGYRFPFGRRTRIVPYAGAGVSSYGYEETSAFAQGAENVSERFTGYQVLGGVEYRLHRLLGVAGEVQWTTVPDAIGAGGISADFGETDLGGVVFRARVLFGR